MFRATYWYVAWVIGSVVMLLIADDLELTDKVEALSVAGFTVLMIMLYLEDCLRE